jgi:hypothetical protein
LTSYSAVQVSQAGYHHRSFVDVDTKTNVRNEFGRSDYEQFRPGESVPKKVKQGIEACMSAYDKIGIIKHVIDLMGDFACKGIDIKHPNRKVQAFYRYWFHEYVNGHDRSERFLNLLYRTGNVCVYR